jgi:transposase
MYLHANAKLGLAGRLALVRAIEEGLSLKAAAAAFSVSPATAHRWWHRWLDAGRESSALLDRSSRPHRSPRLLARELQRRICDCRRKTGWGPRLVAGATGFAHSTVWKVLHRHGLSRRAAQLGVSLRVFLCIGGWFGVVGDAVSEVDAQDGHCGRPVVTGLP